MTYTYSETQLINSLKAIIDFVFDTLEGLISGFTNLFSYIASAINTITTTLSSSNYAVTMIKAVFNIIPPFYMAVFVLGVSLLFGFGLIRRLK